MFQQSFVMDRDQKSTALSIVHRAKELFAELDNLDGDILVSTINDIKELLHAKSPFGAEPVDCVLWVLSDNVTSNDYNPNSVAPPEMKLLEHSIREDGYTQPIVTWIRGENGHVDREVVDGFHRNRVGKESPEVRKRVRGYLPVVTINHDRTEKNDRIAATIRHNRARGKHRVDGMRDIVAELKKRNWTNSKIARELGMDDDEVLRLCQITGLTELFADEQFSQSWDAVIMSDESISKIDESDIEQLDDSSTRVFHEWQSWECYPAGFYSDKPPKGMTVEECETAYRDFLADLTRFDEAMKRLPVEWPISCEHYLTNDRMNRIAWLGQASMCIATGIPSRFCGGYNMLTDEQKSAADLKALENLNEWLEKRGCEKVDLDGAGVKSIVNLY